MTTTEQHHAFDSSVASAYAWLSDLMSQLELAPSDERRAVHALRAGLHAIRDRLPAAEVVDLAAQLPTLIRGIYFEGWQVDNDPGEIRDRTAMYARVRRELAADPSLDAYSVLRAVIALLHKHVSAGELHDVISTLPGPIAELWKEAAGGASEIERRPTQPRLVRHTGYSR